jgi:hypothetical protein
VLALLFCAHGFASASEEEFDVTQYIEHLAREAGGAYSTAAEAAIQAQKQEQASRPSKQSLIDQCVCDQRASTGDPCTEASLSEKEEQKWRDEIDTSCNMELAQMPEMTRDHFIQDCVKRRLEGAGLTYTDPKEEEAKEAARKYAQEMCQSKVSASYKSKVINVVEDAESAILKCMCARSTCRTDEEQLAIEEAEDEFAKACKKQVAMKVAEAMGEGDEGLSKEEMGTEIQECVCESRSDTTNPCLSAEQVAEKKAELEEIQNACRKPLHDEL